MNTDLRAVENIQTIPKNDPRMVPAVDTIDLASGRFLNATAVRAHALRCSAKFKGSRFTRVGQDFLDEVEADVEAHIRTLRVQSPTGVFEALEPDEKGGCVTGALRDKVAAELNRLVCRIIQNKTQRQPSVGKTLGRTR